MSIISPNIKMLIKSIMVSENAIVGSVKGAESTIQRLLIETVKDDMTTDTTDKKSKFPAALMELAREELETKIPGESQIKDWFLYDEDFSGITFYNTNNGELTFASIARGVDLSSGYQYADNRYEAKSYSDAHCSDDLVKIQIVESALKGNLPKKKIKYCHWVSNKPSKQEIEEFQKQNSQYFPST